MNYRTVATAGEHERLIKKSRFITAVTRIHSEEEAQAFIAAVKKTHHKANHNVWAYQLEDDDHIQRASDDGEPSGTAAAPMLTTLQQMGLHDVCAVTTRYFGGIKLGAGGLIRAYSNGVQDAVRAVGIVERQLRTAVTLTIGYHQLDLTQRFLAERQLSPTHIDYAENVQIHTTVAKENLRVFTQALTDFLSGQVTIATGAEQAVFVPVAE